MANHAFQSKERKKWKFSFSIGIYDDAEFSLQQRVRFLYWLCISLFGFLVLLSSYTGYLQIIDPIYEGKLFLPVLMPVLAIFIVLILCLLLLSNNYYGIAVHLLLISTLTATWVAMWYDKGDAVQQLDTFFFILAILTTLPIFINRYSIIVFLYIIVNICILIVFLILKREQLAIKDVAIIDFLGDAIIATFFIGLVGYFIFRIHNRSMEKALLDFNERLDAEKALAGSEKKYSTLLENMNEVVMIVGNDDRVQYVNKKFTEILGYASGEIIGQIGYILLFDQKDKEIILNADYNRKTKNENQYEISFRSKDGRKINFIASAAPAINSDGTTEGSIIALVDITERKKAEEEMRHSEQRYKVILEAFPDIVMLTDLNGNILYGNESLEIITGITPKDYANPNRAAHIHPDDVKMISEAVADLLTSDKTYTGIIENRFIDSRGETHWFSGTISKITLNNQTVLQTITRDITKKKLNEEELENYRNNLEILVKERTEELEATNEELKSINEELYNQRKELEEAMDHLKITQNKLIQSEKMASLGVLAAGVAHEINNPLNFIKGGVVALENYFVENLKDDHNENVNPLIKGIKVGVKRAAAIVTSLNHYSHQEDSEKTQVDLHTVIENCLLMLNDQIEARIDIEKDFTGKPFILICNEGRLHQAFLNILQNSVHSIEKTGKISIVTQIKKSKIIISITDTGCGINSIHLSKIKDPFFTTKEPGKGTGLGIPISINIFHDCEGTLDFESQQGVGTKAIITLPIQNKIVNE